MPYRRRRNYSYRRRPVYRRRRYRSRPTTSVAGIVNDVRRIKRLINVEQKAYSSDDLATIANLTTSGSKRLLNGLVHGHDNNNRNGRKVKNMSVQFKGYISKNATAGSQHRVRLIILIDKAPNGSAFNTTDFLTSANVYAARNLDHIKRFVVLTDRVLHLDDGIKDQVHFNIYKKLRNHTVYDDSNNGDITDINSNAIYAFLISNNTTAGPSVLMTSRLRYVDN